MRHINFEVEKSYIIAYNELNEQIRNLEYRKAGWPSQFTIDQKEQLNNFRIGSAILKDWLQKITFSEMTVRKMTALKKQLSIILEVLYNESKGRVTANQGLVLDNFIYSAVARMIGSGFYSTGFISSYPTFHRSTHSDFDTSTLCMILSSLQRSLEKEPPENYVVLERRVSDGIDELVALFQKRNAA